MSGILEYSTLDVDILLLLFFYCFEKLKNGRGAEKTSGFTREGGHLPHGSLMA